MPLIATFLIAVFVLNFSLGAFVLQRNYRSRVMQMFFAITIFISAWAAANYLTEHASVLAINTLASRLAYLFGFLAIASTAAFSTLFAGKIARLKLKKRSAIILTVIVATLSLTTYVAGTVDRVNGELVFEQGPLIALYLLAIAYCLFIVARNFSRLVRRGNQLQRSQARIMLVSLGVSIVIGTVANVIIPLITNDFSSTQYGPAILSLFLVSTMTYAIVRHKVFDVRAVVAKAVAYLLVLTSLVVVFLGMTLPLIRFVLPDNFTENQTIVVYMAASLVLALAIQPIKRWFDKLTSRIFYKDAYDTQSVLDRIGKIIVGSIDLHKIQKSALEVLADALKPTGAGFFLKTADNSLKEQDFVGQRVEQNHDDLVRIAHHIKKKAVIYDELDQSDGELGEMMRKSDISLIVPLITKNETVGYFMSGPKKSGDIFNQQDKSMLTIAANELAVALQNAQRFEEIQAFNVTLQEKVNEATRELKSTNKKLVALDEAKDEFISMASHQLRTPLTSIKGYLSMILDGDMGKLNKNQQSALKEAFGSSQRMVFLISDFLNVSRIKTGKFVIEPVEVNLATMVAEELNQLKELAESRDVTLKYEQPEEFPTVKLDDNKIRQVMMNMVDNAIYYTPAGGTVTIELASDGKELTFKVVDTGIGVPKSEQHKLFGKFFRAGNAKVARPDGTGLGLFMAQKIIVAQKGAIIFESEEGKGSTFGFRFPLKSIKP